MLSWHRPYLETENTLYTLRQQTVHPAEIIVVDGNDPFDMDLRDLCTLYGAQHLSYPMTAFSIAKGTNYGIKRAAPSSHFVMTICAEMLLAKGVIAKIAEISTDSTITLSPCGFLPPSVKITNAKWAFENHLALSAHVNPNPPVYVSGGTLMCLTRAWWHMVHGFDVTRPFAYADSVVWHMAKLSGFDMVALKWKDEDTRILHPYHDVNPLVSSLGGSWPAPYETNPIRNDENWGE